MAFLPIYLYGHDVLRRQAQPVSEFDNGTVRLIHDMIETMEKSNGIGLAANQVGVLKQVITVDLGHVRETEEEEVRSDTSRPRGPEKLVLINPAIVRQSGSWVMEEGCLSIPDVRAEVERSEKVTVRFRNARFEEEQLEAEGLLGRVILHEIDHLNGVLFLDHLGGAKRALLRGKLRKIRKGEVETSYPVVAPQPSRRPGRVEV